MITLDAYEVWGVVFVVLVFGLLGAMKWASRPQPEEEGVVIRWVWEDVQMLRPDLTEDDCHVMLMRIGDKLHELSVSEGWATMDYLIQVESE
jgi:hypothetical protein